MSIFWPSPPAPKARRAANSIRHADSFHRDLHPDLKADYIPANPPFNDSDWRGDAHGEYADAPGFCKAATPDDIREHG